MSRAIYWFRHIRTKQVLATLERSVLARPRLLKGQIPESLRPSKIRPDHWTPLVVAHGFETEKHQTDAFTLATQPGHPLVPLTREQLDQYRLLPNAAKRLVDMDMEERQIAQLARTLIYLEAVRSPAVPQGGLKMYWETMEWVDKVEGAGLKWPQWVQHRLLDTIRGNIILNPELRSTP
ncbi:hypothetical protein LPJ78_002836 [Coemansia sp. RSA 989]|nr:hypothetical protein BX667DRAFT_518001 [Coemansia mojavensis]KAJ1742118.1 hypothetical protein LPJ68_002226 [Coemansia sp. RSA 1086]KAJ1750644.1 hypothetical protein LPJ79_002749 [Coemansia sp. RSA 1821]KAJ1865262.1 hypothetical protein LPJ78_002836 [Coemansia sp. RSA 989]KAJ1872642.1 hypothetical protein LPJ55_002942 [Coemansia sp. RSA 990]KAJ2675581.1 hypothetical protein IWW42_001003 [Coemansia sp. RSA 1085]